MRYLLCSLLLFVGCEEVALPTAKTGTAVTGGPFLIHVAKGVVVVGKERVSLDGLAAKVRVSAAAAGMHKIPNGFQGSNLYALLRVDKDTPWQHVQWILTVLAQEKVYRTSFAVANGKLDAHLPVDRGVPGNPPQEIKVAIHIVARKEQPVMWGPKEAMQKVTVPTAVKYRFGDRAEDERKKVAEWIDQANRAAQASTDVAIVGEIKAGHKVPFHYVVGVLDEFHAAGIKNVHFFGTQVPTTALRALPLLPYPKKNY